MTLFEQGNFFLGCNYWASHAGTNMWSDWRADIVADDFRRLSAFGLNTLRVFPLWPVFQPITRLYAGHGEPREYRFGEAALPDTEAGRMGMSEVALDRFAEFCAIAETYGMKLIVGLITGWMSGRLYVPPALEGLNVITDPTAIMWQTRFIRYFIARFKNEQAIEAWDLGNECNCMGPVASANEFYAWTSNITGAIRGADNLRPVVSGMHSLLPDNEWLIQHQAELTDILTTHPYPYFTPHCDIDCVNTIRTELHATAETLFYRGIGGKPCFVEECGTLGPMFSDEARAADFLRTNLFSLWAHDCGGFLWWCANDQSHLKHAPYDWNAVERQLGLFRRDKSPKPVLDVFKEFKAVRESLGIERLPPRLVDGVCVLSRGQDTWGVAYMSFVLAKQAGLDIEFAYSEQVLPDAPLYLMPSVAGDSAISLRRFEALLDKVENGAVLYISMDGGVLSPFGEFCGLTVLGREMADCDEEMTFLSDQKKIPLHLNYRLTLEARLAKVLAVDGREKPIFTVCEYGKGKVFILAAPLEQFLTGRGNTFGQGFRHFEVYAALKAAADSKKVAWIDNQNVGISEHITDDTQRILVLINYDPQPVELSLHLSDGWQVSRFLHGSLNIPANDAAVMEIQVSS